MDEYLGLDWFRCTGRSERDCLEYFSTNFSDQEDDIFYYHLNEIDPIHSLNDDDRNSRIRHEAPIDPRTKKKVEKLFVDTTARMKIFPNFPTGSRLTQREHQLYISMLNGRVDSQDNRRIQNLKEKIETETQLFKEFTKNYFLSSLLYRKQSIEKDLDYLVVELWKKQVRNLKLQNVKYQILTAFSMSDAVEGEAILNLTFEKVVLEKGFVDHIILDRIVKFSTLKRNPRIVQKLVEEDIREVEVDVEKLIVDNEINFSISAGTLSHLMDTFKGSKSCWFIPFSIERINDHDVVIVKKKLPPIKIDTMERNKIACQHLIRNLMKHVHILEQKANLEEETGKSEVVYKVCKIEEYLKSMKSEEKIDHSEENVTYRLWKLKEDADTINLLISSRQDCYEKSFKERNYINISVKLEYQSEFGAEQMTKSELIREWCRQKLRPGSKTLRLRINVTTKVILSHKYLTLQDIEQDMQRLYDLDLNKMLYNTWNRLKLVRNFPLGSYLMKHDVKNANSVMIYKICDEIMGSAKCDLKETYENIEYSQMSLEEYTWTPIDQEVITNMHRDYSIAPCLFPHWVRYKKIVQRAEMELKKPAVTEKSKKSFAKKKKRNQRKKNKNEPGNQAEENDELSSNIDNLANLFTKSKPEEVLEIPKEAFEPVNYEQYASEAMICDD